MAGLNEWSEGEEIIPLTLEKAREWTEENLEAGECEKVFGEVSEDGEKKGQFLKLSTSTAELLKMRAAEDGKNLSAIADEILKKDIQ